MIRRHFLSITTLSVATVFALVPGCTTLTVEGDDAGGSDPVDATVTTPDTGNKPGADAAPDAKKDAGSDAKPDAKPVVDAAAETGPPAPAEGSACTTVGQIFKRGCGFCGNQEAICEGTKLVSAYGLCSGEVANGCTPGSTRQAACGLCGTRQEICQNSCQWAAGGCTGEVAMGCSPGSIKTTTAGCNVQGEVKVLTCENTCMYGQPSACGPIPTASLAINANLNQEAAGNFTLSALTDQIKRYDVLFGPSACPAALDLDNTSFVWIKLTNPTNMTAKVSVWGAQAAGGQDMDTVIGWYNTANPPANDTDRLACTGYIDDDCQDAPCDTNSGIWGGLIDFPGGPDARPSIPPNGAVVVLVQAYSSNETGTFALHVRTDSLL